MSIKYLNMFCYIIILLFCSVYTGYADYVFVNPSDTIYGPINVGFEKCVEPNLDFIDDIYKKSGCDFYINGKSLYGYLSVYPTQSDFRVSFRYKIGGSGIAMSCAGDQLIDNYNLNFGNDTTWYAKDIDMLIKYDRYNVITHVISDISVIDWKIRHYIDIYYGRLKVGVYTSDGKHSVFTTPGSLPIGVYNYIRLRSVPITSAPYVNWYISLNGGDFELMSHDGDSIYPQATGSYISLGGYNKDTTSWNIYTLILGFIAIGDSNYTNKTSSEIYDIIKTKEHYDLPEAKTKGVIYSSTNESANNSTTLFSPLECGINLKHSGIFAEGSIVTSKSLFARGELCTDYINDWPIAGLHLYYYKIGTMCFITGAFEKPSGISALSIPTAFKPANSVCYILATNVSNQQVTSIKYNGDNYTWDISSLSDGVAYYIQGMYGSYAPN